MRKLYLDIIEFIKQLIETPSQNGIDSEKKMADLVFKKLSYFRFSPKIVGEKKHPSVFCKINKNSKGKTVWLEACLDTVPAGKVSKWESPPFKATVKNGKMYGRGVADSKTAIAIFTYLAKELSNNTHFKGNFILGFDADEQSGRFTGVKEILKKKPKADVCILGYQGIEEISIGARGWLRLKITTKGKSAHTGSRRRKGNNAIHQMVAVVSALEKLDLGGRSELYFDYGSSFNVSLIKGGVAINVVPDECEIKIDIRFLPSQTEKEILDKINKTLKKLKKKNQELTYKVKVLWSHSQGAYLTNPQNEFVKLLQETAQKKLKKKIPLVTSGAGSVGNLISKINIPIINCFGCECGNVHAPNEWVDINTLPKVFEIYKESILKFCK